MLVAFSLSKLYLPVLHFSIRFEHMKSFKGVSKPQGILNMVRLGQQKCFLVKITIIQSHFVKLSRGFLSGHSSNLPKNSKIEVGGPLGGIRV